MKARVANIAGSVRYGTTPSQRKKLGRRGVEPRRRKRAREAFGLEIAAGVDDVRRRGDPRRGEAAAFLGLRRRVVDLGDAQALDRLDAIGEGVEAGAEDDDLPHAARDRAPRRVLGETAAHGDVEAQAA